MSDRLSRGLPGALWKLLRSWWRCDRVRVSPLEGRLLRLQPPCLIRVSRTLVEITARTVGETSSGQYLVYRGETAAGSCLLHVCPIGVRGDASVRWTNGSGERVVPSHEVEVLG